MEKTSNEKITYFLYARKSSESEDRQVQSIEDQISRLEDLAKNYGLAIKETLVESKSAKNPHCRPVFTEMLSRIEKGEANAIISWQLNRLSRNPVDSGTLSWMLQQGIIKSIQTIDKQYLPDDNVLLFNVESGMANQFIIDLRKTSKRGMEGKAERGWLPSRAPIGYLNEKLEHTIYEDPERFHLIRKMWDLMLTGNYTAPKIVEIANKEWGLRTPKSKRLGGKEMTTSEIYRMFSNLFYTGMFMWGGKLYQGNHKPMITMDEYDRVQVLLGRKGKPRPKNHEFAYTGIIVCSACGGMITATEKTKIIKSTNELKTYVYYHCGHRKDTNCPQKERLTLEAVEEEIDMKLERYTILPEFRDWALEILNRSNDQEIEDRTKIYEMQHKSLTATQHELDNLTRMRYRDLIDDETFVKERDVLQGKIIKLKENLRATESRAEKWLELTEKTFNFATYARIRFTKGSLTEKREILTAIGQNFYIKGEKVLIEPNEWFVPIEKAYPELEAEYKRLELNKNLTEAMRNELFSQLLLSWGAHRGSNPR